MELLLVGAGQCATPRSWWPAGSPPSYCPSQVLPVPRGWLLWEDSLYGAPMRAKLWSGNGIEITALLDLCAESWHLICGPALGSGRVTLFPLAQMVFLVPEGLSWSELGHS